MSRARTKGGLHSKPQAACDGRARLLVVLLIEGQVTDSKGAALMLGDSSYGAGWCRKAFLRRGIVPCGPFGSNRKTPVPHDQALYRQRPCIENTFVCLTDWRRILNRSDRCAHLHGRRRPRRHRHLPDGFIGPQPSISPPSARV